MARIRVMGIGAGGDLSKVILTSRAVASIDVTVPEPALPPIRPTCKRLPIVTFRILHACSKRRPCSLTRLLSIKSF